MYVFKTITSQYLRGNSDTEMRPVEKFPPLIIRRAPEEGHDWLQSINRFHFHVDKESNIV